MYVYVCECEKVYVCVGGVLAKQLALKSPPIGPKAVTEGSSCLSLVVSVPLTCGKI